MTTARPPRRRRRLILWGAFVALVVLVLLYARCRGGLGLGGGDDTGARRGSAAGPDAAPAAAPAGAGTDAAGADAAPPRCQLRVDGAGITLDGAPATEDAAVAACRTAGAADVLVTGDAVQGTWDRLHAALDAAGVRTFVRGAPAPGTDGGAAPPPAP